MLFKRSSINYWFLWIEYSKPGPLPVALKDLQLFFIYLWLCWVFVSARGLTPVAASGGHSSSRCAGLSLSRLLLLWSTGSGRAGSVIVAHGPSRSAARGVLPDQGSNPCPLRWQADSQPLRHQGRPEQLFLNIKVQHWIPTIPTLGENLAMCFNSIFFQFAIGKRIVDVFMAVFEETGSQLS